MKQLSIRRVLSAIAMAALVLAFAGCASIPEELRDGPAQSPDPLVVRAAPEQFVGTTVRWGGVIVTVENTASQSIVQLVSRPLDSSTRPLESDQSSGRFIVRINGFIDPVDYAAGRELTVIGSVEGVERHTIGAYPYTFPVVRAASYYLWPLRLPPLPDPYYYSPFYHPWYPYYGPYP